VPQPARRTRRRLQSQGRHALPGRDPGRRRPRFAGLCAQQGGRLRAGRHALEKDVYAPDVDPRWCSKRIAELNADPAVHGILVQLPLPKHFDVRRRARSHFPEKDVDGFHAENVGALMQGHPRFIPCTPYGVMKLLESTPVALKGKPKPSSSAARTSSASRWPCCCCSQRTVTICHSQTKDLAFHTRRADILVAARRQARGSSPATWSSRAPRCHRRRHQPHCRTGKLCGDVDFDRSRKSPRHHAGARRCRPDDHHHAAGQHARSRRKEAR
jgi:methylenetetrahydrofolate dehydrogenase (NADP+)/methenyltetrahydrofolate cyclohydrolase